MNLLPIQLKLAAGAAITLLIMYCTWYITSDHYQKIIAQQQVQADKAVQAQLVKNQQEAVTHAANIKTAEEQHAQDQLNLNTLRGQLERVQVHIPISGCTLSTASKTGADPDRETRVLSDRVDAAFARLQSGIGELVTRCEQLNIDARQFNASQ